MDPRTGGLRALVSRPHFDPNIFLEPILTDDWQALQEKKPFLNRAFVATYPPGSIFKLVTISAALEHNYTQPTDTQNCKGYVHFGKRKYWCNLHYGHGEIDVLKALAQSCNILFYELGKIMDIDLLAEYAHKFGFGTTTNILFPEQPGLVPTRKWKEEKKGERWWQGETVSVAIGQSFLLVTPIQVARMISSIFTGSLTKPRISENEPIEQTPLGINQNTLNFLQESMKLVVTMGTGKNISKVKDLDVYAKTSTSQTSNFYKRNLGQQFKEHGWFAAYFSYKDHPPLTMVILIENIGSSRAATAVAKNFLAGYKKMVNQS